MRIRLKTTGSAGRIDSTGVVFIENPRWMNPTQNVSDSIGWSDLMRSDKIRCQIHPPVTLISHTITIFFRPILLVIGEKVDFLLKSITIPNKSSL